MNTICDATKKAPMIEAIVPSHEVIFIILRVSEIY